MMTKSPGREHDRGGSVGGGALSRSSRWCCSRIYSSPYSSLGRNTGSNNSGVDQSLSAHKASHYRVTTPKQTTPASESPWARVGDRQERSRRGRRWTRRYTYYTGEGLSAGEAGSTGERESESLGSLTTQCVRRT